MSSNNPSVPNLFKVSKSIIKTGRNLLTDLLKVNFIFAYMLFPLLVLISYFASFKFLLIPILEIPQGVTSVFVNRSLRYLSLLAAASTLFFFIIYLFKSGEKLRLNVPGKKITGGDLIVLLLPLTPVIQYVT